MKPPLAAFLALFVAVAADLPGAEVLSNLGIGYTPDNPLYISNNTSYNTETVPYLGSSFVVGTANSLWDLQSVTLRMENALDPATTETFTVAIYENNGGAPNGGIPGARLGALTGNANPATAGDYTYTAAAGSIQRTAGSKYWLVAEATGTTTSEHGYVWDVASGNGTNFSTQATGWSVDTAHATAQFNSNYLADSGNSWKDFTTATDDNIVWTSADLNGNMAFSISAIAAFSVPEPARTAFCLLGLLSIGLRRMRQR